MFIMLVLLFLKNKIAVYNKYLEEKIGLYGNAGMMKKRLKNRRFSYKLFTVLCVKDNILGGYKDDFCR